MAWPFICTNLNSLHLRMLCAKFGWNWSFGSSDIFLKFCQCIFVFLVIISPWKNILPFIWINLNSLYPGMLCAKFSWNLPRGSGEEDFYIFVNIFSIMHNYLPFEKGGALQLKKLESPSPKDALCQVWLKLAQWFWRRRFLHFRKYILLFHIYLPLEKSGGLHLHKLESPLPKDALCQV